MGRHLIFSYDEGHICKTHTTNVGMHCVFKLNNQLLIALTN